MMYQSLPYTDVWVKKSFLMGPDNFKWGKDEMIKGVLVGVKATRGSLLLFEVYLPEYHASYDKLIQAGIFNKSEAPDKEIKLVCKQNIDEDIKKKILIKLDIKKIY